MTIPLTILSLMAVCTHFDHGLIFPSIYAANAQTDSLPSQNAPLDSVTPNPGQSSYVGDPQDLMEYYPVFIDAEGNEHEISQEVIPHIFEPMDGRPIIPSGYLEELTRLVEEGFLPIEVLEGDIFDYIDQGVLPPIPPVEPSNATGASVADAPSMVNFGEGLFANLIPEAGIHQIDQKIPFVLIQSG